MMTRKFSEFQGWAEIIMENNSCDYFEKRTDDVTRFRWLERTQLTEES